MGPARRGAGKMVRDYIDHPMTTRILPIQCLLTFEALARLRSVTLSADELCVTPNGPVWSTVCQPI